MARKKKPAFVDVPLEHPIEIDGAEVVSLRLRRPKLKHLKGIALDEITGDALIGLIGKLSDIPPSQAGEIDLEDLEEVAKAIEGFMPASLKTGGKLSPK